jgi:hypothetical protein
MSDKPVDKDSETEARIPGDARTVPNVGTRAAPDAQPDAAEEDKGEQDSGPQAPEPTTDETAEAIKTPPLSESEMLAQASAEIRWNRLEHLQQSIMKAQALLAFSAEADVELPTTVVAGITEAQQEIGKDSWTPQIEMAFWSAYGDVSRLVQPVTSDSVDWTTRYGRRVTLQFILFGIISLLCLIGMQIVWVYINNTSTQIRQSIEILNKKEAEIVALKGATSVLKRQEEVLESPLNKGTQEERDELRNIQGSLTKSDGQIQVLLSETDQLKRLLTAQYVILADWVPEFGGDPKPEEPGWFDSDAQKKAKSNALEVWYEAQSKEPEFQKEYLLAQADSFLALMSKFFLPLFYGMLGTAAFILRSVSRSIRERTLDGSITLNFLIRIPLGMLSGIAVGLFLDPKALPTGWEAVQPVAFAFLAGYSVELIFTAMDRLVGAFTGRNQPGTPDTVRRPAG